jgi:hypothetical protein
MKTHVGVDRKTTMESMHYESTPCFTRLKLRVLRQTQDG